MRLSACPSCGVVLPKIPQRKTKCKACGEFIFIKCTPDNRERRLMTFAQAEAAEAQWQKRYEDEEARRAGAIYGLDYLPNDPDLRYRYYLMKLEEDLAKLDRNGVRSVQLKIYRRNPCFACKTMEGRIVDVRIGAAGVVPPDCSCEPKGSIGVSGWIKWPDGTGGVDFRDEPLNCRYSALDRLK